MSTEGFFRELVYPFTNLTLCLWIIVATVLAAIASAAGLFGLWLLLLLVPAWCKYLVLMLRDRMLGLEPSVPAVELFNPVEKFWALGGAALFILLILAVSGLERVYGPLTAAVAGTVTFAAYPVAVASMAVGQSGLAGLNLPKHLMIIQRIGWRYLQVFLALSLAGCLVLLAEVFHLPQILQSFLSAYSVVLLFSFTGALLYQCRGRLGIETHRSPEKTEERFLKQTEAEYRQVATHAYGFISRGNRAGGMKHIRDYLDAGGHDSEALRWFYNELCSWDIEGPALEISNVYLASLLARGENHTALKVAYACLERDHRYRPPPQIAEVLIEHAEACGWNEFADRLRAL